VRIRHVDLEQLVECRRVHVETAAEESELVLGALKRFPL
jgi:hypothetical protein